MKIRLGMFETNSSSTHSLLICKTRDYEKWKDGDYYIVLDTSWLCENYPNIPIIDDMFVDVNNFWQTKFEDSKFSIRDLINYREHYEDTWDTQDEEIEAWLKESHYGSINSVLEDISIFSYKALMNYTLNTEFEEMDVVGMRGVTAIPLDCFY